MLLHAYCQQYSGRQTAIFTVIPEDIQLEDMEDGEDKKNQWLIRTPKKSFFVSATSIEEKRAWIENIENYRSILLQDGSHQPNPSFAVTWIPDRVSKKCMRCFENFTPTNRRHHCRKCGFLVCDKCSKYQVLIDNINAKKEVRVCKNCYSQSKEYEISRYRGDSTGRNSSEEEDLAASSDGNWENGIYTFWLENQMNEYTSYPSSNIGPHPDFNLSSKCGFFNFCHPNTNRDLSVMCLTISFVLYLLYPRKSRILWSHYSNHCRTFLSR